MKYVCDLCGFVYNEAETAFADLPGDYTCPECGSGKNSFISEASGEAAVHTHYDSQR